ncbi:TRADD-N-associated membrane domain-containing protein [Nostoc sp.]|uniref:TRADD-N-associated membrane domain-containing protein n=1 Tax=Nostoc sp. TaxID=1180 RepID=UPI002FF7AADE
MIPKKILFVSASLVCLVYVSVPSYAQPSSSTPTPQPSQTSSNTDKPPAIIASIIVALAAGVLVPISQVIVKRIESSSEELASEAINKIANLVKAESEREKAAIIRVVAEESSSDTAITEIREKLKNIETNLPELNKPIKSVVENLIKNYHSQALTQAGIQFYFSLAAATVGFFLIIYAGISAVNTDNPKKLWNTLPGAVISVVSALFFKQAEETRKRATDLYDRLRLDERQAQAITIANTIESEEFRSLVQAQLVFHLADVKDAKPIDLSSQVPRLIGLKDDSQKNM